MKALAIILTVLSVLTGVATVALFGLGIWGTDGDVTGRYFATGILSMFIFVILGGITAHIWDEAGL